MNHSLQESLRRYSVSRRHFLRAAAVAGGLTAAHAFTPSQVAGLALSTAAAQDEGDVGVLNFALGLEHLERRLYSEVISGGLLADRARQIAEEFRAQEDAHVDVLTDTIKALGGDPVEEDEYNWPELSSEQEVLDLLVDVEDVGVAAYLGATSLVRDPELLTTAATIHNVEAYHATGARLMAGKPALENAFGTPQTSEEVLKAVGPFYMKGTPSTGAGGASSGLDTRRSLLGLGALAAAAAALRSGSGTTASR